MATYIGKKYQENKLLQQML